MLCLWPLLVIITWWALVGIQSEIGVQTFLDSDRTVLIVPFASQPYLQCWLLGMHYDTGLSA